jgi:hypothetical protein
LSGRCIVLKQGQGERPDAEAGAKNRIRAADYALIFPTPRTWAD